MTDVYADMLFLVDFAMDLSCLCLTRKVLNIPAKTWRIAVAAAVGGVYSVSSLFIPEGVVSVVTAVIAMTVLSTVAFYRRGDSVGRMTKIMFVFLGMNALLGGAVSAVFGIFAKMRETDLPEMSERNAGSVERIIYLSLAVGCILARMIVDGIKNSRIGRIKEVKISFSGKEIKLLAIKDSGNLLREPLSGRVCVFISPVDLVSLVGEKRCEDYLASARGEIPKDCGKILLIPAKTVGGNVLLPGFYPESVFLIDEEGKCIKQIDAAVAVERENAIEKGFAILPASVV